jgi:phenylacetate-coenzyme A ligase PaaK-like adenylate-forming protein
MKDRLKIETSLEEEQEAQRKWVLHDKFAGIPHFSQLLYNEFLSTDRLVFHHNEALQKIISFAEAQVPYYKNLFEKLNITSKDIRSAADLVKVPVLSKRDVYENEKELQPVELPSGEKLSAPTSSSGSTGRPTIVAHSERSHTMFYYLSQRQMRAFRMDPSGTMATIRLASQLPAVQGRMIKDGETGQDKFWRYSGHFFKTGPYYFYTVTNPVDAQLDWLDKYNPTFLQTYSETLEHLSFACGGVSPIDSIQSIMAISEQLTPSMRKRVENTFKCPVDMPYGLNEIGLAAFRCNANRYHVHMEHCLVEIVDDNGIPCAPGERGKIVITALQNYAMPLIRYDTDDMAEVPEGPCPCGRTLQSFGDIAGRYSRIAFLPDGTLGYVGAIRDALEKMPRELAQNLRKFQVHQFKDSRFELYLETEGKLPEEFSSRINQVWQQAVDSLNLSLKIIEVDDIARSPGGKFLDFTSDYFPSPDSNATPNT